MLTYHPSAQALHWITASAIICMLCVGLRMTSLPLGVTKLHAYNWHTWVGLAVPVFTGTGEIVLDPAALGTARIDIRMDTRPVSANDRDFTCQ